MFGIGSTELLVILVVALLVLGPKSIPQIAKTLGKAMAEFRRVSTDFQRTLNAEAAQEEHEKRKKEAEQELFGDKPASTADASAAPKPAEQPAARPTPAAAPESPANPAPVQAEVLPPAEQPQTSPAPASPEPVKTATASSAAQADTPLARAVAKAAAEAQRPDDPESKPVSTAKPGESA